MGRTSLGLHPCDGATVVSWYGDELTFGTWGHPQAVVNVLGNASAEEGVSSLEYSLEGGDFQALPLGPDMQRLHRPGDFNVSIPRSALVDGANTLQIRATGGAGDTCTEPVTLIYDAETLWPMPFGTQLDTSAADSIEKLALVVDGLWELGPDGVRTKQQGYDRMLAIGDERWPPGYEIRTTVTVHEIGSWGGVGLAVGWQGHTGMEDPPVGWPVGALGWVRNKDTGSELLIRLFEGGVSRVTPYVLEHGKTYGFAMISEPVDELEMRVAVKVWAADAPEPEDWTLTAAVPHRGGSAILLAHAADVTFHDVDIRPSELWTEPEIPDGGMPSETDGGTGAPGTQDGGTGSGRDGSTGGDDGGATGCSLAGTGTGWQALILLVLLLGRGVLRRTRVA